MQVDLTERSISEQIKVIANIRNCSVKNLGEKFNELKCPTLSNNF